MPDPHKEDGGKAKQASGATRDTASHPDSPPAARTARGGRRQNATLAYAMGRISLEDLYARKKGAASRAAQDVEGEAAAAAETSSHMEAGMDAGDNLSRARATSQAAAALHRLKAAKDTGVLTRAEADRASDMVLEETPAGAVPTTIQLKTPRQAQAESIVQRNVLWASGLGLLSFGMADIVITPAVQLKMIQEVCSLYGVGFTEEWGKNLIAALLGTATAGAVGIRMVPVVGMFAAPVSAGVATYLLGKVITQHLESGGTLLSFDPAKLKTYFADYYDSQAPVVPTTN